VAAASASFGWDRDDALVATDPCHRAACVHVRCAANVGSAKMIQTLDQAAQPADEVRVLTLRGDLNPEHVRQILSEVLNHSAKTAPAPPARDPGPAMNAAVPPAAH
jgi:hypothetical protein